MKQETCLFGIYHCQKLIDEDILAVFCTGAYGYSMANNYNRIPRPPVVFVENGEAKLVIKRETYEDLVRLDLSINETIKAKHL